MSKASLQAYLLQLNSGKAKDDKVRIYQFIKSNRNCTKDDLITRLNIPHQTVTARLSDLLDAGVVFINKDRKESTTSLSHFIVTENPVNIFINKKNRDIKKFNAWKRQGLNKFSGFLDDEILKQLSA